MNTARDRVIDELLVMRCQQGDRQSFNLLVRRWQKPLWRYARSLTGDTDAAWDVTQETWMAILAKLKKLSDPAWFAAWAYRIVHNKAADRARRAARRKRLTDTLAREQCPRQPPPTENPGDDLADALRKLAPGRRELLMLKYDRDLNLLEIALVLGIPVGTVKSRLYQARNELKRILEGDQS